MISLDHPIRFVVSTRLDTLALLVLGSFPLFIIFLLLRDRRRFRLCRQDLEFCRAKVKVSATLSMLSVCRSLLTCSQL
jgi:hypothetical protein